MAAVTRKRITKIKKVRVRRKTPIMGAGRDTLEKMPGPSGKRSAPRRKTTSKRIPLGR